MTSCAGGGVPAVTVLMPVRDAAPWLGEAIDSVLAQTFEDWECILADDGSEDDSMEIARRFADIDRRFVLLPGPHLGLVGTLERGRAACRGTWVARMDADDLMIRDRLRLQVDALAADAGLAASAST